MKPLTTNFQNTLESAYANFAYCVKLDLANQQTIGVTSWDSDLLIEGVTYQALSGFDPFASEQNLDSSREETTIEGLFSEQVISEELLVSGILDEAFVRYFLVDPYRLPDSLSDSPADHLDIRAGYIKKTAFVEDSYKLFVSNLSYRLQRETGISYSKYCRADHGSQRLGEYFCGVDLSNFTENLTINAASTRFVLVSGDTFDDQFFEYGTVRFTSGKNNFVTRAIKSNSGNQIILHERLPFVPEIGDTFDAVQGCARTKKACIMYNNMPNFKGEGYIPGNGGYYGGA